MVVCLIFWLVALPLGMRLWRYPYTESFSSDERLIGTILLFLPVFGVILWGLYFQRPSSKRSDEIFPSSEGRGVSGISHAMWAMAETARQNASFLSLEARVPQGIRRVWRFLRWPVFLCLVVVVIWFNSLLLG